MWFEKRIFKLSIFYRQLPSLSGYMWYEFRFGTIMGSGDIEVLIMQGKASTLKGIKTDIRNRER